MKKFYNLSAKHPGKHKVWPKIVNIFLPIDLNMFLVLNRTISVRWFFEYKQHMFWLRNNLITHSYLEA